MKGIQNTTTENLSTIIGNNKHFVVPKFQRDYSWDSEQWDDLWRDIEDMCSSKEEHYMGYLVLQTTDDKQYQIIDGQQRFTTITLLILAAIKSIKNLIDNGIDVEKNQSRIDTLSNIYIGKKDPVSLTYDNILRLNRNNDPFYADYIVPMENLSIHGLTTTEKLMKHCFEFYLDKLSGLYETGEEYAMFIQTIANQLYFTTISVSDDLNAFKVFETLNARGVQLSSADLLKNYLFSLVDNAKAHRSHIDILENQWVKLTENIKSEKLPEFIRYYWNSKHKSIRANALFRTIRAQIISDQQVFELMKDLLKYSDVYMALKNDKDQEIWPDAEVRSLITLLNLFRLKQPYSALMSAKMNVSDNEFKRLLKAVIAICFRYNVICDKNPNDQDSPFNMLAIDISDKRCVDLTLLNKIYVSDAEFERAFSEKSFPYNSTNAKIVRYILSKLNHAVYNERVIRLDDEEASIEHVLPKEYSLNWGIEESEATKYVNRLGNLCLLERSLNRDIQNITYDEKMKVYEKSTFVEIKQFGELYPQWNASAIEKRQRIMGKIAKGIWNVVM